METPLTPLDFARRAGKLYAGREAVVDGHLRFTYGQFTERCNRGSAALASLGVEKGDRVATLCWNHHAHLECYFGIPAAGGVMHTLNLRLSPDELGWIADDAQDRFIVVDDILLPLLRQFAGKNAFEKVIVFPFSGAPIDTSTGQLDYEALLADADADGDAFVYAAHDENDPVAMCYTSGTTGRSKGVVYSHRSTVLHTLVGCLNDHWGLRSTDCLLPVTPMFHANSWGLPYGAVMLGIKIVLPGPHLHPDDLLDLITALPPTLALGVPTIWMGLIQAYDRSLVEQPGRWKLPNGMRSLVGGAAVPEALIRAFAKHGVTIGQGWGMTETSPLATSSYLRAEIAGLGEDERFRRAAMAGVPVPLVDVRIRGDDGHDAPWDGKSMGEIQCHGPFITGSYHGVPVSEDKFSADGWLRTGDVAVMDELGFVRITDRTKDLIKSGGEWISSVDLENALMAHPAIAEAAVIAIPSEKWSERPLACIVWKKGAALAADRVVDELGRHLLAHGFAKWQLPDRYEAIEGVPRTSTGKFWKLKLRERFPR